MILTVGNTKGGVGKTTLAVQIALSWAIAGRDVLLVDADRNVSTTLIQPGLEFRLGVVASVARHQAEQGGRSFGVMLAGNDRMTGLPGSLRYVAQCRGSELARHGVQAVAGDKQEGSRGKA